MRSWLVVEVQLVVLVVLPLALAQELVQALLLQEVD